MKKVLIFMGICALAMGMISCEKTSTDIPSDNSGVLIGSTVYETIQGAIDAAEDGDTLRLTQGIYAGTDNTNLMWEGDEKHLTIMTDQRGAELNYAIIEGNGKGAGFYFGNSPKAMTILSMVSRSGTSDPMLSITMQRFTVNMLNRQFDLATFIIAHGVECTVPMQTQE